MSNFGPPQIFPPVPINEPGAPGSIVQPTTESGVPVFVPAQIAPALATQTLPDVTLVPPSPADPIFIPRNALEIDPDTL
jgi:hypothetical protein